MEELKRFDERVLNTRDEDIIIKSKEVIEQLVSFINIAVSRGREIYIEYN
ncbi:MAG: hypothetical protein U0K68_01880 [Agathobacter sp.]|nr:hypothetical protein [Agathobacter sp.]